MLEQPFPGVSIDSRCDLVVSVVGWVVLMCVRGSDVAVWLIDLTEAGYVDTDLKNNELVFLIRSRTACCNAASLCEEPSADAEMEQTVLEGLERRHTITSTAKTESSVETRVYVHSQHFFRGVSGEARVSQACGEEL
jgi:hypothetical protein